MASQVFWDGFLQRIIPPRVHRFSEASELSSRATVEGLYWIALGRTPDAQDERGWLDALAGGISRAAISA